MSIEASQPQPNSKRLNMHEGEIMIAHARKAAEVIYRLTDKGQDAIYRGAEELPGDQKSEIVSSASYLVSVGYHHDHLDPRTHSFWLAAEWYEDNDQAQFGDPVYSKQYEVVLDNEHGNFTAKVGEPDFRTELLKDVSQRPGIVVRDMEESDYGDLSELVRLAEQGIRIDE